jgi:hypothetical protein
MSGEPGDSSGFDLDAWLAWADGQVPGDYAHEAAWLAAHCGNDDYFTMHGVQADQSADDAGSDDAAGDDFVPDGA